jgi:hypothetical protein
VTDQERILDGPPIAGSEADTLVGALERERAIVAWKSGGLDASGLRTTVGRSSMTIGGLLKHLALIEDAYFTQRLGGKELPPPWNAVDWEADPDWEWRTGAEDLPGEVFAMWEAAVSRSRKEVAAALARGGLDQPIHFTSENGETPSFRRLLIDLVEEYSRHAGHVDLIRESIDGLVGEEPPR